MDRSELSQLTDAELLAKAKKQKTNSIYGAFAVGLFIGVIVYSVVKSTVGFLTLIPLYFIFKIAGNSQEKTALEEVLKERNLK